MQSRVSGFPVSSAIRIVQVLLGVSIFIALIKTFLLILHPESAPHLLLPALPVNIVGAFIDLGLLFFVGQLRRWGRNLALIDFALTIFLSMNGLLHVDSLTLTLNIVLLLLSIMAIVLLLLPGVWNAFYSHGMRGRE